MADKYVYLGQEWLNIFKYLSRRISSVLRKKIKKFTTKRNPSIYSLEILMAETMFRSKNFHMWDVYSTLISFIIIQKNI